MTIRIQPPSSWASPSKKAEVSASQVRTPAPSDSNTSPTEKTSKASSAAVLLSKELDDEAAGYKEDNAVFKEDYEALEQAMELVQAQMTQLQQQITTLKQAPTQRYLSVDSSQQDTESAERLQFEHLGSKKYRDATKIDEVKHLEQQLSELKQLQAELRINMLKMILAERKRLEELARKNR